MLTLLIVLNLLAPGARADLAETEYLSVSTTSAWVREDPRPQGTAAWKVWKYAPVTVVSYRGDWVRIRDFEGDEGWLRRAELSDVVTVCVSVKEAKLRVGPAAKAKVVWILDKGYALRVFSMKGDWYEVSDLEDVSGWIPRKDVWGFPPPRRSE